jgi:hypothetical protein
MLSNHRSFTRFAVALLLLVFSMSPIFAAPSAETAAETVAVPRRIAGAGRGLIQTIGVLGMFPGAMDAMVAVGVTDQGMGDFYELLDPDHENRIRLGKSPGAEELAAANPDLVFLRRYLADSLGAPLETLGIPVEYLDLENPEDFDDDIRLIGSVLGQDERAEQILAWFDARQAALEDAVPPADADSPRVLLLQVSGSPEEPPPFCGSRGMDSEYPDTPGGSPAPGKRSCPGGRMGRGEFRADRRMESRLYFSGFLSQRRGSLPDGTGITSALGGTRRGGEPQDLCRPGGLLFMDAGRHPLDPGSGVADAHITSRRPG